MLDLSTSVSVYTSDGGRSSGGNGFNFSPKIVIKKVIYPGTGSSARAQFLGLGAKLKPLDFISEYQTMYPYRTPISSAFRSFRFFELPT
jgi:hypothetical protein